MFFLGLLAGAVPIIIFDSSFSQKENYVLNEDWILENNSIIKERTIVEYVASYSEGFNRYSLHINVQNEDVKKLDSLRQNNAVIPIWANTSFEKNKTTSINSSLGLSEWCGAYDDIQLRIFFKSDTTLSIEYNNPSKQTIRLFDHTYNFKTYTLKIDGKIPAQIINNNDNAIRLEPLGDELRPDIDLIYVTQFSECDTEQTN